MSFLLNAEFVSQLMAKRAESVARRQFLAALRGTSMSRSEL